MLVYFEAVLAFFVSEDASELGHLRRLDLDCMSTAQEQCRMHFVNSSAFAPVPTPDGRVVSVILTDADVTAPFSCPGHAQHDRP